MIDYLTLLLLNLAAGFLLLIAYLYWGLFDPNQQRWSAAFIITGLVAFVFGMYMTMTWPLPGSYNIAFGEMSVFFGALFLGAGLALALHWDLQIIALYALLPGIAAILVGARIINLKLTTEPILAGVGFILSGFIGLFAAPTLIFAQRFRIVRWLAILILAAACLIWVFTGLGAYWQHLASFKSWVPFSLRK